MPAQVEILVPIQGVLNPIPPFLPRQAFKFVPDTLQFRFRLHKTGSRPSEIRQPILSPPVPHRT
jgi:hypothetical protein